MRNERTVFHALALAAGVILGGCSGQVREEPSADAGMRDASFDGGAPDASDEFRVCAVQDECALVPAECCGGCGLQTLDVMTSVRWDRIDAYGSAVCGPGLIPCPACASAPSPHLTTACRAGRCTAIDVRVDPVNTCATDADCTLRYGTACCELCSGSVEQLTAIPKASIDGVVRCSPNEGACPACEPVYPRGVRAACNPQTRRCEVARR
jgi:hypothetical protein